MGDDDGLIYSRWGPEQEARLAALSTDRLQKVLEQARRRRADIESGEIWVASRDAYGDAATFFVPWDTREAATSLELHAMDWIIQRFEQELSTRPPAAATLTDPESGAPAVQAAPYHLSDMVRDPDVDQDWSKDLQATERAGTSDDPGTATEQPQFQLPQGSPDIQLTVTGNSDEVDVDGPSSVSRSDALPSEVHDALITSVGSGDTGGDSPREDLDLAFAKGEAPHVIGTDDPSKETPRPWLWALIGGLVIALLVAIGVFAFGGGDSGTSASKSPSGKSSSSAQGTAVAASPPTLDNQPLQFSTQSTGATSGTPNTYVVTVRPGTSPNQFVESQVHPTTSSQQLTTETFSSRGLEVSTVTTSSPTGTSSSNFTTPLLVLSAPYRAGHAWTSVSTSTSPTGQETVKVAGRIEAITNVTLAGRNLQVVQVQLHDVVTDTSPRGTVTQDSTGTDYFSPLLGVFVQSKEVTNGVTNQFQLQTIGSGPPPSGSPSASRSTPLTLTCPPTVPLYASFRVSGTLTPPVAGVSITILYTLPDGERVTHNAVTDSSGNYTTSIATNQRGTETVQATSAPTNHSQAQAAECTILVT